MRTILRASQANGDYKGKLKVDVVSAENNYPIQNAKVIITYTDDAGRMREELQTDSTGQTETIELNTPPLEFSQEPGEPRPYSEYNVRVEAEG